MLLKPGRNFRDNRLPPGAFEFRPVIRSQVRMELVGPGVYIAATISRLDRGQQVFGHVEPEPVPEVLPISPNRIGKDLAYKPS